MASDVHRRELGVYDLDLVGVGVRVPAYQLLFSRMEVPVVGACVSGSRRGMLVALARGAGFALAPAASAASCVSGGQTFAAVGAEQCYTVSAGVSELQITVVGAKGGSGSRPGGLGAVVTGEISVSAGETLYVEVGSNGSSGGGASFGGGGGAGEAGASYGGSPVTETPAGSGGGASDVRTVSCGSPCNLLSPASLASRLLVAAGGGGGGAGGENPIEAIPGGAGGSGGSDLLGDGSGGGAGGEPEDGVSGGGGGGGATESSGGNAGSAGSGNAGGDAGVAGELGTAGDNSTSQSGGGGGGYYGGGSGGGGGIGYYTFVAGGGGGGAGSSFAAPFVDDPNVAADTTGVPEVSITPLAASLSFSPTSGLSFPVTQPEQTLSPPLSLTVTNSGTGPLAITSLTFTGANPQDFIVSSDGCLGEIAAGATCTLTVSFAPQAQGSRGATLLIASDDPATPSAVSVSGMGGPLPQGPAGATGPTGATGTTGATGPMGPTGSVELVSCKPVAKSRRGRGTAQRCTTRLVSGTVKFTTTSVNDLATLSRAGTRYATGIAVATGSGGWCLLLDELHPMHAGSYTATLHVRRGRRLRLAIVLRRGVSR